MKHYLLLIFTVMLLSACSLVNEPTAECPSESREGIIFTFNVNSAIPDTRTDDEGHIEEESELKFLEEGIDFADLGIYIFARMENDNANSEKLLYQSTSLKNSIDNNVSIGGMPGAYTISTTILRADLHKVLFGANSEQKIKPDATENVIFRVLLIANAKSGGTGGTGGYWPSFTNGTTTFQIAITRFNSKRYDIGDLYNENYEGIDVEGLYKNQKRNLPMFGTNIFTVSQAALYYSRLEDPVNIGKVDMLRSLAKLRVVDNIQNKDHEGYPKIINASYISSKVASYTLPTDAMSYINGNQVHTPNIYQPGVDFKEENTYKLGILPGASSTIAPNERKGDIFLGYMPEQRIADGTLTNGVTSGLPLLLLTVAISDSETREYSVPMTEYNGTQFNFGDAILRNHIYTLSVTGVNGNVATRSSDSGLSIKARME